jgi:4-hydroxyproline epimerase
MAERLERFRTEFDHYRSALVNEPRGSDVMVGGLLQEPIDPSCSAGIIFFNNVGYLGMCGHGTIGLVATLAHLGKITAGTLNIETPVGPVTAELHANGEVSVRNVPAYRYAKSVRLTVEGIGEIVGDVAWGGNWFFLVENHGQELVLSNTEFLTDFTRRIREALAKCGITGAAGAEIDHVELFAHSDTAGVDSRNFVLCPGMAYDRSPCGTGTSAKLACLYADGKLKPGASWRQEAITGSIFEGSVEVADGVIIPTIRGVAYVNAESTILINPDDPFRWGLLPSAPLNV